MLATLNVNAILLQPLTDAGGIQALLKAGLLLINKGSHDKKSID